jgi:hypothetical protein
MFESILAYIIMLLPSIIGLVGGIATMVCYINKIRKNSAETQAVVAEAKSTVEKIKSSEDLKSMMASIVNENTSLKKALTLCTEEITRIHKLHPEWLEDGDENGNRVPGTHDMIESIVGTISAKASGTNLEIEIEYEVTIQNVG